MKRMRMEMIEDMQSINSLSRGREQSSKEAKDELKDNGGEARKTCWKVDN
jgi:hypothetical protein